VGDYDRTEHHGTPQELVRASDPDGELSGRPPSDATDIDTEDLVPDPLPEADSASTAEAWDDTEAMEGEAPTG
jgi:hypothetical protein